MMYRDPSDPRGKAAKRRYYERNKEVYAKKLRERKARVKKYLQDHLACHPCVDCGEADIVVLDFDHVRGTKKFNLANAGKRGVGLVKLDEEIAKCEIRCANCHRRKTHRDRRFIGV